MRKRLYSTFRALIAALLFFGTQFISSSANAQSRLIHYWSFNSFANIDTLSSTGCVYPVVTPNRMRPVAADYSIIDTAKAKFVFTRQPGVSSSWPSVGLETVCFTWMDSVAGSATNARLGASAGTGVRPRNPTDSMQILLYVPTNNYQNIAIKYVSRNSSTSSGPTYMLFDYSIDSGSTWIKTGLSKLKDSAWTSAYNMTSVSITNPQVNNNPRLVFRIRDSIHTSGGTGNIRYDNFTVEGDTIVPSKLIHFWHFNNFTGVYHNPHFYPVKADYSIIDTNKATVLFGTVPGTDTTNPTYFDFVTAATADYDTVNAWFSVPGGNGIRMRNPNDSSELWFYMPTTHYKNIRLTFATIKSSIGSGDSIQVYDYSIDSGITWMPSWRISGISEVLDSANSVLTYKRVTVNFTDPAAFDNNKLVFRIRLLGKNTGTTGNNRFDNISVEGDSIIGAPATITTTAAAYGPFCSTVANTISVGFSTTGTITGPYSVQITNANGTFPVNVTSNVIGTGTASPITAVIPPGLSAGTVYRVRVVTNYPYTYGSDNTNNITLSAALPPITGTMIVCQGLTTTLLDATAGGTWTSSNAGVATAGSSTGVITGVSGGAATITYAVPSGCMATAVYTVNPAPSNFAGVSSVCLGLNTTLSDTITGGAWSSSNPFIASIGSASGVVSGISTGSVTITYTLPTGCFRTKGFTVNPLPSAITGASGVCEGSTVALSDASPGGSWSSSNTALATVGSTGIVSGLSAGTPVITYTLATGCIATTPVVVNPLPLPISGSNGCVGTSVPFTDATAFGAWSSSNTAIATVGSSTGIVSGVATGTTNISYTLSTGCFVVRATTINSLPTAITGLSSVCVGSTISVSNSTPGGTWSSSNTALASVNSTSGVVTGVAAGNPVLTYTMPTGCIATMPITVNPLPAAIGGATSVYCIGSTATLTDASAGGLWSSSNTSIATVGSVSGIVTGIAAGAATITYALPTGCIATLVENITSSPAAITGSSSACVGATTAYSDITAFGAWTSSNTSIATVGSGTGIVTGIGSGVATITYSLSSFCLTTKAVTVNVPPSVITGIMEVCPGNNITLSDTGSGTWSSSVPSLATVGFGTGVVTGVAAGTPVITYTAPSGCIATAVITVNPLPAPIGGTTSVYCIGSTATLTDASLGGAWTSSNVAVATVGSSTGIVTGITAGTAIITYTLPTGCITTLTENITSTPAPISGASTTCVGSATSLTDLTAFGAWSSSNSSVATIGSGTGLVTGVAAGTATITYQLSPFCLITMPVTVNSLPAPISGVPEVCTGSATVLTDAGGGSWASSIPALATVGAGTGVVTGIVAGAVVITYTLPTGCMVTTSFTVNPLPGISGPGIVCIGTPASLTGSISGGTWTSGTPSVATAGSSTGIVSGVSTGTATITYTLPSGCVATNTVTVNPPPSPISGVTHICSGFTTILTNTGSGGWYSSNPAVATIGFGTGVVTGLSAGTTTITYSLGTGCIATMVFTVDPLPSAITGTAVVCPGVTTTLSDPSAGGAWSSSDPSLASVGSLTGIVTGMTAGTATITYTLPTGCITTVLVTVNPVSPITGTMEVCQAATTTLGNAIAGGIWSSSNTTVAAIGSATGIATGVSAGAVAISYTLPTGCIATTDVTVDPVPAAVTGAGEVCIGATVVLSDTTSGGTWSSGDISVATIGSTGIVTGISVGTSMISYVLATGCMVTRDITVNALPSAIAGTTNVCVGLTTVLSDSVSGGAWSSGSAGIATVGSGTGVVTGVAPGAAIITYMLPSGCSSSVAFVVNQLPLVDTVTGGGSYCAGGTGIHMGLNNSDTGVAYQLYLGSSTSGAAMAGLGTALDFGTRTVAGTYTVVATNTLTACVSNMYGHAIVGVNPLPVAKSVTGGGSYCFGDPGRHIGLSGSDTGVNYQLFRSSVAVGSIVHGSGAPIDFGVYSAAGNYMVTGTNTTTSCNSNMSGSVNISVDTLFSPVVTITAKPGGVIHSGHNDTLKAAVINGGAGVTYQWLVNATYIAGAVSATYITNMLNNGDSVTCLVSSHSPCGSITSKGFIKVSVDRVGVPPIEIAGSKIVLVPNPNKGTFKLSGSLSAAADQQVVVTVTNMLGQAVYSEAIAVRNGMIDESIKLGAVANGMYILSLRTDNDNIVFHIVVEQ